MKRVNNIYNDLVSIDNIIKAYNEIKHIKNKYKIEQFEDYYSINIVNIYNVLKYKTYNVGKYNLFMIYEPKQRLILNLDISDKVINKLVANKLIAIFNNLIDSNVATRKYKGTGYGIKLIKKYMFLLDYEFYILKIDIYKYFYSINHDILKKLLNKKIKDKDFINLLYKIIDSTNQEYIIKYAKKHNINYIKYNYGLPIGNLTSQILGSFYLNELDHYIKEELKIKYYIRYVDDMVLFHKDKNYLKYCYNKIVNKLKEYDLKLNNKTCISKNSLCFLGYRFYNKNIKVLSKNRRRIYKKLRRLKDSKYDRVYASYKGYFKVQRY